MPSIYGASGFVIVNYTSAVGDHKAKYWLNIDSVAGYNDFVVSANGGSSTNGFGATTDIAAAISDLLSVGQTISTMEYYSQPTLTSDPLLIGTYEANVIGTGDPGQVAYGQLVLSWGSALGGIGKFYFMETGAQPNQNAPWVSSPGGLGTLRTYLLSDLGVIVARDGARAVVTKRITTKTNDALRKRGLGL